ncbi:MAG: dTMP kinase [Spirochaetales bacterium]|nr:dTMP kinase [Spirochaetales bacterium]
MKVNQDIIENFIVIEGLDGSGTTTQLDFFCAALERAGIPHTRSFEPTKGPVGGLIRSILKNKISVDALTMAFLFAADRNEHLKEPASGILSDCGNGRVVVSDRYLFSSLAYQSVLCDFDAVYTLNRLFPLPSHLFFLDVPIEVCMDRVGGRAEKEIYETAAFQEKVLEGYEKTFGVYAASGMAIHRIDGSLAPEVVFQKIWDIAGEWPIIKR